MSRVIKYRAFDKNSKQMVEVLQIAFSFTDPDGNLYEERIRVIDKNGWKYWLDEGQYELMEFSGILDKNGREIYEGDVVKNCYMDNGHIDTIFFKNGTFLFGEYNSIDEWYQGKERFELEVIGNIHENPELLKAGDK